MTPDTKTAAEPKQPAKPAAEEPVAPGDENQPEATTLGKRWVPGSGRVPGANGGSGY